MHADFDILKIPSVVLKTEVKAHDSILLHIVYYTLFLLLHHVVQFNDLYSFDLEPLLFSWIPKESSTNQDWVPQAEKMLGPDKCNAI